MFRKKTGTDPRGSNGAADTLADSSLAETASPPAWREQTIPIYAAPVYVAPPTIPGARRMMKHRLAMLFIAALAACGVAATSATAALGGAAAAGATKSAPIRLLSHPSAIQCRSAIIGGQRKCIAAGQFCANRYERDYNRYGYTCRWDGRYYRLRYR